MSETFETFQITKYLWRPISNSKIRSDLKFSRKILRSAKLEFEDCYLNMKESIFRVGSN